MRNIKIVSPKFGVHYVKIDNDDFDRVRSYNWILAKRKTTFYAVTTNFKKIFMHRMIMNSIESSVDHIDRDGLNNQKYNLRHATQAQNNLNKRIRSDNTTGYIGVYKTKNCPFNPYWAYIQRDGKRHSLGYHPTKEQAAMAYNKAATIIHGEFASLNKIES